MSVTVSIGKLSVGRAELYRSSSYACDLHGQNVAFLRTVELEDARRAQERERTPYSRCNRIPCPPYRLSGRTMYPRIHCPPDSISWDTLSPYGQSFLGLSVRFRITCPPPPLNTGDACIHSAPYMHTCTLVNSC